MYVIEKTNRMNRYRKESEKKPIKYNSNQLNFDAYFGYRTIRPRTIRPRKIRSKIIKLRKPNLT